MKWISVKDAKPKYNRKPDSLGTPVIVYCPRGNPQVDPDVFEAYYGCRATGSPEFYLYGAVLRNVTHWMPFPEAPK